MAYAADWSLAAAEFRQAAAGWDAAQAEKAAAAAESEAAQAASAAKAAEAKATDAAAQALVAAEAAAKAAAEPNGWKEVRTKGFVAVASRPIRFNFSRPADGRLLGPPGEYQAPGDNYVFHDFETDAEAVRAYVATGEATVYGFSRGVPILEDAEARFDDPTEGEWPAGALPIARE